MAAAACIGAPLSKPSSSAARQILAFCRGSVHLILPEEAFFGNGCECEPITRPRQLQMTSADNTEQKEEGAGGGWKLGLSKVSHTHTHTPLSLRGLSEM